MNLYYVHANYSSYKIKLCQAHLHHQLFEQYLISDLFHHLPDLLSVYDYQIEI